MLKKWNNGPQTVLITVLNSSMINFPYPPSLNHLFAGQQRRYKSKKYKAWIAEADIAILQQRPHKIKGKVKFSVLLGKPDKRRRDLDNVGAKAILDRLVAHGIIEDDSLVESIFMAWADVEGAVVEILPCR